jgi:hypothetical protein
MAEMSVADLFEVAKLFFGDDAILPGGVHAFYRDTRRQYVVLAAIKAFAQGDGFFKAFGDVPMPSYTPYGVTDLLMLAGRSIVPSKLEDRIKTNAIGRTTVRRTYLPWWQNPETYAP